jgi:hypothetical protein
VPDGRVVLDQGQQRGRDVGPTFTPLLQRWTKALAGYTEAELTVAAEVLAAMTDCIDDAVTTLRRPAGP